MALSVCEACGAAFKGEPTECEGCDEAMPSRGEIRRLPHQVVLGFLEHAEAFLAASPIQQFVLAFAAGSFVTFGALLSVLLTVGVEPIGVSRLLLGLGFSAGFVMIILSGSALFTQVNVLLPELFLSKTHHAMRRAWRFWLIAYLGNAAGALVVGLMVEGAHILGEPQSLRLFEIMGEKLELRELGSPSPYRP